MGRGLLAAWCFWAVDGSCAWRGFGVRAPARVCARDEQEKGIGWMPWRQEAMKDVARCENPGEAASGR